jgi:hypothetical protein
MKFVQIVVAVFVLAAAAFAQQPFNDVQINGVAVSTGNGVTGTGVQRVTIASDNTAFQVKILGNTGAAFDAAGQNVASPANEILIGGQFNTSPTTITTGNMSPLQVDSGGKLLVNCTGCSAGSTVGLVPQTSGGLTLSHTVLAASTNATSLKGSAGQVYSFCLNSNASYPVYLKLYNKATAPTVGTDTPVSVLEAQAGVPICKQTEEGFAFATGIAWAATKGITDADTTAVLISDGTVEIAYK